MFRGEILSGAGEGDWLIPHRARLEEVRLGLTRVSWPPGSISVPGTVIGELEALVVRIRCARTCGRC